MHYLVSCSIVKNEDDYIDDFIKINKFLGIEHFILYDRSINPLSERYKGREDITVIDFPEPNRHADAWLHCINNYPKFSKWTVFFDIDQVLFPVQKSDLKEVLQDYEGCAAVQPNWHTFGSSGLKTKTPGSLYERFVMRGKDDETVNNHTQTIAQISRVAARRPRDPHHLWMNSGEYAVNESRIPVNGPFSIPPTHHTLFFAHYVTKTYEEYVIKCDKGRADINGIVPHDMFYEHDNVCNTVRDERILNVWKKINSQG
jgi:hypothetical protein